MFGNKITAEDIYQDGVLSATSRIYGDDFNGDVSFVASMKALFHDKIIEGETLRFKCVSLPAIDLNSSCEKITESVKNIGEESCLTLCYVGEVDTPYNGGVEILAAAFSETHSRYDKNQKIEDFFRKNCSVKAFTDSEKRSAVMITGGMGLKKFHYLQCAIAPLLCWYGVIGNSMSADKIMIAKACSGKEREAYIEAVRRELKKTMPERAAAIYL